MPVPTLPAWPAGRPRAHRRAGGVHHDGRGPSRAAVSRRTGEAHRAIHGRINRETGAASVTAASVDQFERGNRLLERQASKRR